MKEKTFAQLAEELAKKREKYEVLADSPSPFERNTAERMLKRTDRVSNMLKDEQVRLAPAPETEEVPVMAPGGFLAPAGARQAASTAAANAGGGSFLSGLMSGIQNNLPLLSDLGGSLLDAGIRQVGTNSMQAPPSPSLIPRTTIDTSVDYSPQLRAVRDARTLQMRSADRNLRDSQAAEAFKNKAFSDSLKESSDIQGKSNFERAILKRTQAQVDQRTNEQNAGIVNNFKMMDNAFQNNRTASTVNNWSGALTNFRMSQRDRMANAMDMLKAEIYSRQFGDSGIWQRNIQDIIDQFANNNSR